MGKVTNNFPKKTYFCLINLYAMKITIVSGARPNFMKIAPITRAIKAAQEAGKKISYLSLIHISEPTRQAEISYAVFCLKKKKK